MLEAVLKDAHDAVPVNCVLEGVRKLLQRIRIAGFLEALPCLGLGGLNEISESDDVHTLAWQDAVTTVNLLP